MPNDRQRVSSRGRENTWLSWAKTRTVGEQLGSGFPSGKWAVGLLTPMSCVSSNNLTKWEGNHHKGLLRTSLFPIVCFPASRGLPFPLSPRGSLLPFSLYIMYYLSVMFNMNHQK